MPEYQAARVRVQQESQRAQQESQRAQQESQRAQQESQRAQQAEAAFFAEQQRSAQMAARLRSLGVSVDD
jgi:exopolyphosphatase/pppGpp-phosphohydrolase